jgi:hypothetical protein
LLDCYENPGNLSNFEKNLKTVKKKLQQKLCFSGQIIGFRGPFIFLSSGVMIDLKALQGFVVEGHLE